MNLAYKLRIFKIHENIKDADIARELDVSTQTIRDWKSKRSPKKLKLEHAEALVTYTDGFICMKDCGYDDSQY